MVRTQIQLDEEQYRGLKEIASARSVSMAELVREGVDALLRLQDRERRWATLWRAVGSCRASEDDGSVSVAHDDYLADVYHAE